MKRAIVKISVMVIACLAALISVLPLQTAGKDGGAWMAELDDARDTATAIRYDKDKIQTSPNGDMVFNAASRAIQISEKVQLIDGIIQMCADDLEYFLRLGVCYGLTFNQLKSKGMPCEHKKYYEMRRRYYYELSRMI